MVASLFELTVVVLEAVRVDCLIIAFCLMTGESLQTRRDAPIAEDSGKDSMPDSRRCRCNIQTDVARASYLSLTWRSLSLIRSYMWTNLVRHPPSSLKTASITFLRLHKIQQLPSVTLAAIAKAIVTMTVSSPVDIARYGR